MRHASLSSCLGLLVVGCFSAVNPDEGAADTDVATSGTDTDRDADPATSNDPATTSPDSTTTSTTSDDGSTSDAPSTTSNDSDDPDDDSTTDGPPDPFCGDGNVDPGEECDDGDDNGPGQACLEDCTLNVCGDNDVGPDEACDDGDDNALELGACAPDCSGIIEAKEIVLSSLIDNGHFGANPIPYADGHCPAGYKAMFAHGQSRVATTTAYASVGSVDWVLQPYTAYTYDGDLVWITDEVPLLGVRNGQPQAVETTMAPAPCSGQICLYRNAVTGMNPDWTTRVSQTCNGWSSSSDNHSARLGDPHSTTTYLDDGSTNTGCSFDNVLLPAFYCVEQ